MDDYKPDRLESVDLKQSNISEKMLVDLGTILYNSYVRATRVDELELMDEAIGEYVLMTSYYSQATDRIPESLGVDLNVSMYFRLPALKNGEATQDDWRVYAEQFRELLLNTAEDLECELPKLDKVR